MLTKAQLSAGTLAAVFEMSSDCVKLIGVDGRVQWMNANGLCAMEIDSLASIEGKDWASLWPEESRAIIRDAVAAGVRGETVHLSAFCPTAKGQHRWWDVSVSPVENEDRAIVGCLAISRDITSRKSAEATRDLLMQELEHRVNNAFAAVQSIAAMTVKPSCQPEAWQAFEQRLRAMAESQSLLTSSRWQSASLPEVVRRALRPFAEAEGDRLVLTGPPVNIPAGEVMTLSLALHELATNACKYGAWSTDAGQVWVKWQEDSGALELIWSERGGPAVTPPTRKGFGSVLISKGWGPSRVSIDYRPEGVQCRMILTGAAHADT